MGTRHYAFHAEDTESDREGIPWTSVIRMLTQMAIQLYAIEKSVGLKTFVRAAASHYLALSYTSMAPSMAAQLALRRAARQLGVPRRRPATPPPGLSRSQVRSYRMRQMQRRRPRFPRRRGSYRGW